VGTGLDYGLEVELGSMLPAFATAVEATVRSSLLHGNEGWEIPDARVRMTHSGYWAPSSTAGDFRNLTRLLMARAIAAAGTVVCLPVHRFELEVPVAALGPTLSLLAHAGGVPLTTEPRRGMVVVTGDLPADQVHRVALMLPDVTRGEGVLTSRLDHFAPPR
jgi:ribosomal protection tetracycline resistance protein